MRVQSARVHSYNPSPLPPDLVFRGQPSDGNMIDPPDNQGGGNLPLAPEKPREKPREKSKEPDESDDEK